MSIFSSKKIRGLEVSLPGLLKSFLMILVLVGWQGQIQAQDGREDRIKEGPSLSLWKVDEAHLANHHEGEAYHMTCGEESYLKYQGPNTSEDVIIAILNEGARKLRLKLPLQLEAAKGSAYEIIEQPVKNVLEPEEETHFIVRYTAPETYQDDKASIQIGSNDPDHQFCQVNFDVGSTVPGFSKVFSLDEIGPGSVSTLTFTINNSEGGPVTDLAFTDVLPAGMNIAIPAAASTTCTEGTLSAPDGGTTISLSGGKVGEFSSCTVSVNVTSATPGTHMNVSGSLTSSAGSSGTASDDLIVATTLPGFTKSFVPSSVPLGGRSTLTFTVDNSANMSAETLLDFDDILPAGMVIADPPNVSTNCGDPLVASTIVAEAGTNIIEFFNFGSTFNPAIPAESVCTLKVDVTTTLGGELGNISSELVLSGDRSSGKASDILTSTITPLAIQKSFLEDPTVPGGTTALEFKITNFNRDFEATGISFTDDLSLILPGSPDVVFSSLTLNECGGSLTGASTSLITLTGASLSPNESCTIQVLVDIPPGAAPGIYTNTTSAISGTVDDSPIVGNMASDDLFITTDPTFTKEFIDDPSAAGGTTTLRFTITNNDPINGVENLNFLDDLNTAIAGLSANGLVAGGGLDPDPLVDPCGTGSELTIFDPNESFPSPNLPPDPTMLKFSGGNLAPAGMAGDGCTFDVVLDIPAGVPSGIYTNVSSELNGENTTEVPVSAPPASADLVIIGAPRLTKEFIDDPVLPGGTTTLRFTVEHDALAPADATDIAFSDDLTTVLSGLTATSVDVNTCPSAMVDITTSPTMIVVTDGMLSPGATCDIDVTLTIPGSANSDSYSNTTSNLTATVDGLAVTGNAATDNLEVSALRFTKEFIDDPAIPGSPTTLRFTIENLSATDNVTSISFTDNLDETLEDLVATGLPQNDICGMGSSISGTSFISFTGGNLIAGAPPCTFDVVLTVPAAAEEGNYPNVTSNLTATIGMNPATIKPASDQLIVNSTLLSLIKEFTDDPVTPGDPVTLEFRLANLDAVNPATMISFTDDLSTVLPGISELTLLSEDFNDCGATVTTLGTDMISVTGAALGAAGSCTIRLSIDVPANAPDGTYTNTTSDLAGDISGFAVKGDAASDNLIVRSSLLFSKSFDGPTTATGTATLTFTITNPTVNTVTGLSFSDNLDDVISGLVATSLPSTPCGAISMISGTDFLTFSGGELPPMGGTCSFDVEVLVPATATAGTFLNTTSNLSQLGLNVADPATAELTIEPPPTFAKVFTPDMSNPGDVSTLTFTIDNTASSLPASSLDFTDNLPAAIVVAAIPNASTTCTGGTLTAAAASGVISYTGGTVAAGASCTVTVDVTSVTPDTYVNTTGDLTSSSGNSGTASDTWTIACPTTNTADISGTISVCINSMPEPEITFTYTGGLAPYTFTYNVNGGMNIMKSTTMGNSVSVPQPTSTANDFEYTLVSAVDAAGCTAILNSTIATITVDAQPVADAGPDQNLCNTTTFTMAAVPSVGSGMWTFVGASGGAMITTVTSPMTMITSVPTDMDITLRWTETNGACSDMDDVVIRNDSQPAADAGPDQAQCDNEDFLMAANPSVGTGTWTTTNSDISITSINDPMTMVTGLPAGTSATLTWTEVNGICMDADDVIITNNTLPTATISASTPEVCEGDADPDITFTGADGTAPYTFTYTINGGPPQMVTTIMGNSVTVAQSTGVPGTFVYSLVSVQDDNMCSQIQLGSTEIIVSPQPGMPGAISGPAVTCPGLDNIPYEVAAATNATSYNWSFTDAAVVINGNGTRNVTLDGVTTAGTLSVAAENDCGMSTPSTFEIAIASPEICVLADCTRNAAFIDDPILAIPGMTDVFQVIELLESNATIEDTRDIVFRAGESIVFFPPFTVEIGGTLLAEIQSCFTKTVQFNQKK